MTSLRWAKPVDNGAGWKQWLARNSCPKQSEASHSLAVSLATGRHEDSSAAGNLVAKTRFGGTVVEEQRKDCFWRLSQPRKMRMTSRRWVKGSSPDASGACLDVERLGELIRFNQLRCRVLHRGPLDGLWVVVEFALQVPADWRWDPPLHKFVG